MDRKTTIVTCAILILIFISATVYGAFVSLWRASVTVTVTAASFKKSLQILTRPYVPIANLTVNYELIGQSGGENVYRITGIQLRLIGYTGYYRVFIRDSNKNIIWSTWGFCGTGFIKSFTPTSNVKSSYEIGISIKGVDDIAAIVKPFLKFTDWYVEAAEKLSENSFLLSLILDVISNLADMLKPEDVDLWKATPVAVAKSSAAQFDPETPQWSEPTSLASLLLSYLHSPGELRVYDSIGRVTGLISGEIVEEIPNSVYFNNTVIIFPANDSYIYEVAGIEEGVYGIVTAHIPEEEGSAFIAGDIPVSSSTIHQFIIDWAALTLNEGGVIVKDDSNADGIFERIFASDNELDQEEFELAAIRFQAIWENISYSVFISTNSTVSNFAFNQNQAIVRFNLKGTSGSHGYCNVTIPATLLKGEPWAVLLNGTNWSFTATQNETHSFIRFNYTHTSTYEVIIQGTWVVPEFPSTPVLLSFILMISTTIILLKKRRQKL
ncbi:MAG: hypothetical protein QXH40_00200 [Candidatus Bathyarchaeia archaeon]